jgi:hypothetical protein
MMRGPNPGLDKILSPLHNVHTDSGAHPPAFRGVISPTHRLVPRLRVSGATPLLPLYAFIA